VRRRRRRRRRRRVSSARCDTGRGRTIVATPVDLRDRSDLEATGHG